MGGLVPPLDQRINNRIAHSSLAPRPGAPVPFRNRVPQGVFVDDARESINKLGIGRPTGPGATALRVMRLPVDPLAFAPTLTERQLRALGWQSTGRPSHTSVEHAYLAWGADHAGSTPFYGHRDGFACAAVAMLVAKQSPLPVGASVEWFGMLSGDQIGVGHSLTVVERAPGSDPGRPAAWGSGCMIVDPWYALQAGGPVTRIINGPNADPAYVTWLTAPGNSFRRVAGFITGSHPWLTVEPI